MKMNRQKLAKIEVDGSKMHLTYRGKCLVTVLQGRLPSGSDFEAVENREIETFKSLRAYAMQHGFSGVVKA
jgi:hypothetical protein